MRTVGAFLAVILSLLTLASCDEGRVLDERYFRLTQELTVDGEPVTVSAVFRCQSVKTYDISGVASGVRINALAMARRLESGGAVILQMPAVSRLCGEAFPDRIAEWRNGRALHQVYDPDGYKPHVFLLDDADAPTRIEAYMSSRAYEVSGARVGFVSISGEPLPAGEFLRPDDPRDATPWISTLPLKSISDSGWSALSFRRLPPSSWRSDPALEVKLAGVDVVTDLSRDEAEAAGLGEVHGWFPAEVVPPDAKQPGSVTFRRDETREDVAIFMPVPRGGWPLGRYALDETEFPLSDPRWAQGPRTIFDPVSGSIFNLHLGPHARDYAARQDMFIPQYE